MNQLTSAGEASNSNSVVSDTCSVTGFSSERLDYDLGKVLLETIIFERIDQIQQQHGIDQASAFNELFLNPNRGEIEIVQMAAEELKDPSAFTMADFLPLFANTLVKQQMRHQRNYQAIEELKSRRKKLLDQFLNLEQQSPTGESYEEIRHP